MDPCEKIQNVGEIQDGGQKSKSANKLTNVLIFRDNSMKIG